jgi:hypothetical protein
MVTTTSFPIKYLGFLKMDKNKCPKSKSQNTFPPKKTVKKVRGYLWDGLINIENNPWFYDRLS